MNPNDDLDRMLQHALDQEATRAMPTPDFDDVQTRAGGAAPGGARRPWVPAAAAAAVVLIALVAGLFVLTGDDDGDTDVITDPDPTTTVDQPDPETTETTTTTTEPDDPSSTETTAPPAPDVTATTGVDFAGIEVTRGEPLPDGQFIGTLVRDIPGDELPSLDIVRFSADGEVLETLREGFGSAAEGGTYGYELSPDRRTVYFVSSGAACLSTTWAMPADGSAEPIEVSDAHDVAVSPDGSQLALTVGDICGGTTDVDLAVEVVPVTGGPSQRFVLGTDEAGPGSSVWVDDTSIVVSTSGQEPTLFDLDPAAGTGVVVEIEPGTTIVELTAGSDGAAIGATTTGGPFEQGELRIVRYDDGTITEVFDSPRLPDGYLTDLDVLADGRISAIVFSEGTGTTWYLDGEILRDDVDDVTP